MNNKNYYTDINEIIEDVNALGDWRDINESPKFLNVVSKIARFKCPYNYELESGLYGKQIVTGNIPQYVIDAALEICNRSKKFPNHKDVYQNNGGNIPPQSFFFAYLEDNETLDWLVKNMQIFTEARMFDLNSITKEDLENLVSSTLEWMDKNIIDWNKDNKLPDSQPGSND